MMENHVSHTALLMAYVRGYHALHSSYNIFEDNLAHKLLKDDERAIFEQLFTPPFKLIKSVDPLYAGSYNDKTARLAWAMRFIPSASHSLSRSRYTEDALADAFRQGMRQYVILGAGMDTFVFRHPEMLEQLNVFEIDHPATQEFKRHRLAELNWKLPQNLHFIPLDFTKDSMTLALTRSSYNPHTPSFFSWLGVTYYLPHKAVFATLQALAEISAAGSSIIFDYMDNDAFVPSKAAKRIQMSMEKCRKWGETLITGFDPSMLAKELENLGIRLHENLSPSDIQERYFQGRTDGYYACEHVHFAQAVVE